MGNYYVVGLASEELDPPPSNCLHEGGSITVLRSVTGCGAVWYPALKLKFWVLVEPVNQIQQNYAHPKFSSCAAV